ncbi:hypothetical protein BO79DRAFT_63749 [Aspergillus costaricaensis CBS 115574]|uniref:Uncharacterized protein n=1 Tax=Aspergillus costaricaensis CBS 115574 TaxID=1448317 RepID=A0ACD1IP06_9EURO|nr:hypothetical protein BO79DRAFT_63749 [Aspergillus costaricaensis CBS 115574]RAK92308.1 hypothetical protein BO79DRAFT_63749 [Aspergillus costaricaensis CBS 115574]
MAGNFFFCSCFSCIRVLGTAYGMVPFLLTFVLIVAGLFCSMNVITRVPFSSGAIHLHALMLQMHIHTHLRKEHIRGMDFHDAWWAISMDITATASFFSSG